MDVLLISNGVVSNVVPCDSIEAAQAAYPGFDVYLERSGAESAGWAYDGQTFTAPVPPGVSASLTKYQFLSRMPAQKRIAIRAAAKTDPIIEDAMMMLDLAEEVLTSDPMTIQLVGYLNMMGYLTQEEAAAMLV